MIFNQAITRLRAGERVTRSGDTVPDWTAAGPGVTFRRLHVQPLSQSETATAERDARTTSWRVYTRPGVDLDVRATDRIRYEGNVCQVAGEVARWPHPRRPGRVHHIEFTITLEEG